MAVAGAACRCEILGRAPAFASGMEARKGENPAKGRGFSAADSPVPQGDARQIQCGWNDQALGDLDLFSSLCLSVIDSDPKHRKTLLQLLRTGLGPIPGGKFGLESAIYFERIS